MTAAFFDLDNTLIRGASLLHVVRRLVREGDLDRSVLTRAAARQLAFRVTATEQSAGGTRDRALALAAGMPVASAEQHAREALTAVLHRALFPGTVALVRAHQAAGHDTFVATAAPVQIATIVADALGMTGGIGTVAEQRDGLFTGRLVGDMCHGESKAASVAATARARGIDLAAAYAYSDSVNDLPLLASVGHPHAVNPDRHLRRHAAREGWPVHDMSHRREIVTVAAVVAAAAAAGLLAAGIRARRDQS